MKLSLAMPRFLCILAARSFFIHSEVTGYQRDEGRQISHRPCSTHGNPDHVRGQGAHRQLPDEGEIDVPQEEQS